MNNNFTCQPTNDESINRKKNNSPDTHCSEHTGHQTHLWSGSRKPVRHHCHSLGNFSRRHAIRVLDVAGTSTKKAVQKQDQ